MGNNGFSHFSRLVQSTSSAPNAGEFQPEQNVEQEQLTTFSGRPTIFYDPENPYLTSLFTSQAANLRVSTSATATSLTIARSAVQHSPATDDLVNPYLTAPPFLAATSTSQSITPGSTTSDSVIIDPPKDPFALLATYQPISFEERQPQLYSGFGILDDFSGAFSEELEAAHITGQPAGQTMHAPLMDSPVPHSQGADIPPSPGQSDAAMEKTTEQTSHVSGSFPADLLEGFSEDPQKMQEVSPQANNPPVNQPASYQGEASAPIPSVTAASVIPLSLAQPVVGSLSSSSQRPLQPKLPGSQAVSPPLRIRGKVKTKKSVELQSDKYLLRIDSLERRYMCGYPNCGKTYTSSGHLRCHVFIHTGISEHRCTYPQCGPHKYFCNKRELKRHIIIAHLQRQQWQCVVCPRIFKSLETLKAHMTEKHYVPLLQ